MTSETEAQPIRSTPLRTDVAVLENVAEGGGNFRLALEVPNWPGAGPGQFLMLSVVAGTGVERSDPLLPRPMAVFRQAPLGASNTRVEVLYKATGRGTRLLAEALPGQALRVVGPLGGSFPLPQKGGRALLVGGGTGCASLYELARSMVGRIPVDVVLGARTRVDLMGETQFADLDLRLHVTTEDGSWGHRGRVTDLLPDLMARSSEPLSVYACGPTRMMEACSDLATAAGISRCWVSLENTMACGFGVCLGCAVPIASGGYSLLCRVGPVYAAPEIDWKGLP